MVRLAILALLVVCGFCAAQAHSTQIPFRDLTNLVATADHVIIGKVVRVDMVNGNGQPVTDDAARTGPGVENQLRLHVEVAKDGVLTTTTNRAPSRLMIPLWQRWYDTLGNRKNASQGKTYIFLLKGSDFSPVYPGFFMREPSEKNEIDELLKKGSSQNNAVEPPRAAEGARGSR